MRYLAMISLVFVLLVAGCVSKPVIPTPNLTPSIPHICHTVTEQVPYVDLECKPVSMTNTICGIRALPYDAHPITTIHLCVTDDECVGKPLGDCQGCSRAMTRCGLLIENKDAKSSGTWTVGANFTVTGGGFMKDPVTKTLAPNESYEFDFQQMYAPGQPISSAICKVFLITAPKVDDCHDETREINDCKNVTKYTTIQKQVCQ